MVSINKVVIPSAGLGTRLLPSTKELPKEMLPVFSRTPEGQFSLKPLLQLVFEQLFDFGICQFCFIVGRGKRAVEDHFTPSYDFIQLLESKGKQPLASDLKAFYERIEESTIVWINQPAPLGFGHAVLMSKSFVGNDPFLVHAGDTYIASKDHLRRLIDCHFKHKADATLLLQEILDPRQYGVAEVEEVEDHLIVKKVIEKPEKPPSNLAIMPIYAFNPIIMRALEEISPGVGGELQLTDGIQRLLDWGLRVCAVKLRPDESRLEVGSPETYWEAISASFKRAQTAI